MDRGAWQATVPGITKSRTWLSMHVHNSLFSLHSKYFSIYFLRSQMALFKQQVSPCQCLAEKLYSASPSLGLNGIPTVLRYLLLLPASHSQLQQHWAVCAPCTLQATSYLTRACERRIPKMLSSHLFSLPRPFLFICSGMPQGTSSNFLRKQMYLWDSTVSGIYLCYTIKSNNCVHSLIQVLTEYLWWVRHFLCYVIGIQ